MNDVFLQGMRRSGTTIFFDALALDGRFDCYYEPLAAARPTVGGGSGARVVDPFEEVRAARAEWARADPSHDVRSLNYGAPRAPRLELERDLPEPVRDYLRFLLRRSPKPTAMKHTRMYRKIRALREIGPAAKLVHLVRDPRAVATSYLFGRGRRDAGRFRDERAFFAYRGGRGLPFRRNAGPWASRALSDLLLREGRHARVTDPPVFMRVLIVWLEAFTSTHRDGIEAFGEDYLLLRHEDLVADSAATLARLYRHIGGDPPAHVLDWASRTVRSGGGIFAPTSAAWREAFERLDLSAAARLAGYAAS